ncbi:MAG: hypothetical protein DWH87_05320 [Planctomycetota bacterium]|nr:MAG: hypothetical protein DWH87_05320 [Planctomycetota bacterium]
MEIGGAPFRLLEVLKHDSWAAAAIYTSATGKALCKFNRRQPILAIPMAWLGRLLAARERHFHARLAGIVGIPAHLGPVSVDGVELPNAFSREFIEGHVLDRHQRVDDDFFPRFAALLADVHHRDVAHVDLHKRENVLVDLSGRPWLIDFQISLSLPSGVPLLAAPLRSLLRVLQQCDDYHLLKHHLHHRPDQAGLEAEEIDRRRPWWIRLHRRFAVPFRTLRRQLLVWMGIRGRSGQVSTEVFPEVAHRRRAV